jgi:hypothetical protein
MGGGVYNTIHELIEELKRKLGYSRYPAVILHTTDIKSWQNLISELKCIVDEEIYLSNYCNDGDCCPNLGNVKEYVENLTKKNKKIMIVPLGEMVREWGIDDILLFNYETNNNSKIYVPLLGMSKDVLNEISNYDNSDRNERKIPVYEITPKIDNVDERITIYSLNEENFDDIHQISSILSKNKKFIVKIGFKEYLKLWESKKIDSSVVICSRFLDTPTEGVVNIIPLKNLKEVVSKLYGINIPINYKESERHFWMDCLERCSNGWKGPKSEFNEEYIEKFEKWNNLPNFEKWLWFNLAKRRLTADTTYANAYITHVLKNCDAYNDLENMIWMSIFNINPLNLSENILKERATLIDNISGRNSPMEFDNKLNEITNPLYKLKMLYGNNYDNKLNIVKCVGECLKNNISPSEISKILKIIYPDLYCYISVPFLKDEFTTNYIKNYIFAKLKNELTPELIQLNEKFSENNMLWKYPSRTEVIDNKNANLKYVIDGLGIEWCGLIKSKFELDAKFNTNDYSLFIDVGRANLPTTTESNKIGCDYFYDELDKYYHNANYKYPNNIVDEIDKINDILEKILPKISQCSSILITADHGSTRFSGHITERIKHPKNSEIKKNGRFAQSTEKPEDTDEYIVHECEDKYYAISKTYKIFEGGKRPNAESHGGATLEETLVPIITISSSCIISKSISINVLNYELPNYKPCLKIEITPESDMATLKVLNEYVLGKKIDNTVWEFNLKDLNLSVGEYTGTIELSCGYKSSITFKIIKGYEEEEYF